MFTISSNCLTRADNRPIVEYYSTIRSRRNNIWLTWLLNVECLDQNAFVFLECHHAEMERKERGNKKDIHLLCSTPFSLVYVSLCIKEEGLNKTFFLSKKYTQRE